MRVAAVNAVSALGSAEAKKAPGYYLESDDENVREPALKALGHLAFAEDPLGVRRILDYS